MLPVDTLAIEIERERQADIVAIAGRLEGPDLALAVPVLEQAGGADLLFLARLFGDRLLARHSRSRHPVRKIKPITPTHSTTNATVQPSETPMDASEWPVKVQRKPLIR